MTKQDVVARSLFQSVEPGEHAVSQGGGVLGPCYLKLCTWCLPGFWF